MKFSNLHLEKDASPPGSRLRFLAALLLFAAAGNRLAAQRPCDYARCSLSIAPHLTGLDVVRGMSEIPVASLGFFVPRDVRAPFAGSDAATQLAVEATHLRRQATVVSALGAVALAGAVVQGTRHRSTASTGFAAAGASLVLISVPIHFAADAALSRAVWEFNRQFAR